MPPKKHGRGLKASGRPKSGDEEEDVEEIRRVERERRARSRGQKSTPKKRDVRYNTNSASLSMSSPSSSRSRGRPTRSPGGPQTPSRRRDQSRSLIRNLRHVRHVSDVRRKAANKRYEGGDGENNDDFDVELEEAPDEIPQRRLDFDHEGNLPDDGGAEEQADDGGGAEDQGEDVEGAEVTSSRTEERPWGSMSHTDFYRKGDLVIKTFNEVCDNWQERVDVALHLLLYDKKVPCIDRRKMMLKVDFERKPKKRDQLSLATKLTIRRKSNAVRDLLEKCKEPELILEYMLMNTVLNESITSLILEEIGVVIPDSMLPLVNLVQKKFDEVRDELLNKRQGNNRTIANRAALEAAQRAGLDINVHGHIQILADGCSSSRDYAAMILKCMNDGTTDKLFERTTRRDAIKGTHFPQLLKEFAMLPENSRSCPDETISINYGTRADKYLLNKPRLEVIKNFQLMNPDCPYSQRVLLREWPRQIVTPSDRDLQRNVCPTHSNARRLERAINKHLGLDTIPTSVRMICTMTMCPSDCVNPLDPLTWQEECAMGRCKRCPPFETPVPADRRDDPIQLALWGKRYDPVKKKDTVNLHNYEMTLGELGERFDSSLPKLRKHVFVASAQWQACKESGENLKTETILSIEDYQMNLGNIFLF